MRWSIVNLAVLCVTSSLTFCQGDGLTRARAATNHSWQHQADNTSQIQHGNAFVPNDATGCLVAPIGYSDSARGCDSYCDRASDGLFGFGLIQPSEGCFDDFISPMTNPVYFEDPRTLTEVRFIMLHHRLPDALGGNSVQAYAPQIRLALSERLSLIVTKGSVIYTQSPLLESGFLDMAAGFKYNLIRNPAAGRLLSLGMTFEAPWGSSRSFQGNGDGEFHFFATGASRVGSRSHWISAVGLRQPIDEAAENRVMHWCNHLDYRLGTRPLYAFTELNWFHYLSDGTAFPLPIEGGDIFNLGSAGIASNDLVTQAVGLKAKPRRNVETGIAFEFPVTERQGLMKNRLNLDLIVRY